MFLQLIFLSIGSICIIFYLDLKVADLTIDL